MIGFLALFIQYNQIKYLVRLSGIPLADRGFISVIAEDQHDLSKHPRLNNDITGHIATTLK